MALRQCRRDPSWHSACVPSALFVSKEQKTMAQSRGLIGRRPASKNALLDVASKNALLDVIDRVPRLKDSGAHVKGWLQDQILERLAYAHEHGVDTPDIQDWKWTP
jgi:phosphoketolase